MSKSHLLLLILTGLMSIAIAGCSAGQNTPVLTSTHPTGLLQLLPVENEIQAGQKLLGDWVMNFDPDSRDASILPYRAGSTCYDVTNVIPPPSVVVRSYNPASRILDLDISITNPSPLDVFDVRVIIYNEPGKFMLLNPDNWTSNWSKPEGSLINPFRTFAKNEVNRRFAASSTHTENLKFYIPMGATSVSFRIDACYPSNTKIPYQISDFDQGTLFSLDTSSTDLKVNVYDWQDNASEVILYCPGVTGEVPVYLSKSGSVTWETNLLNTMGAEPGNYPAYVLAKSYDSGQTLLIFEGEITVIHGGTPSNPHKAAKYEQMYNAHDCAIRDNFLYVADDRAGLKVIDISDPSNPKCIGSQLTINNDFDPRASEILDINDHYAYIGGYNAYFTVVDISNPHQPMVAGKYDMRSMYDFAIAGNFAVVILYNKVTVLDVSNPSSIDVVNLYSDYGTPNSVKINGNQVYFATSNGLYITSLNETGQLQYVGSYNIGRDCHDLTISSPYAYVIDGNSKINVFDISNPANPQLINSKTIGSAKKVTKSGDYLYLSSGGNKLFIVKITDNTQLSLVSTPELKEVESAVQIGNNLFVANGRYGLISVDVADPAHPQVTGELGSIVLSDIMTGTHTAYALSNGYGFNTDAFSGLLILDITDPLNTSRISTFETNPPLAIDIQGTRAYITVDTPLIGNNRTGLNIIDISNPSDPFFISSIGTFAGTDIRVNGNYAYVAAQNDGLIIIDISDPQNPHEIGALNVNALSVEVSGYLAFIGLDNGGFQVVDIGIPEDPVTLGYTSCGRLNNLYVSGDYVYANATGYSMLVIDVSDSMHPQVISHHNIDGANEVVTAGEYAYVAYDVTYDSSCMEILDVSDPANPTNVTIVNTYLPSRGIDIRNNYAYLSEMYGGVSIIQLW